MKSLLTLVLAGIVFAGAAKADVLRLRDGRMFTGHFLGATQTEIWFQQDMPGAIPGAAGYPVADVESLTFGPDIKQSNANSHTQPGAHKAAAVPGQATAHLAVYRDPVK